MDIISGIVAVSASFILMLGGVGAVVAVSAKHSAAGQRQGFSLASRVLATAVVVYFLAVMNLLIIAEQLGPALASFLIGLVVLAVLYVEPAVRARRRANDGEEEDSWRS